MLLVGLICYILLIHLIFPRINDASDYKVFEALPKISISSILQVGKLANWQIGKCRGLQCTSYWATPKAQSKIEGTQKNANCTQLMSKTSLFLRWATFIGSDLVPYTCRGETQTVPTASARSSHEKLHNPEVLPQKHRKTQFLCTPPQCYGNLSHKTSRCHDQSAPQKVVSCTGTVGICYSTNFVFLGVAN